MKPFAIVLSINLAFFAIWGLFFSIVQNRPELIPLMTSLQAAFNLLFASGFFLDRKKDIGKAFLWGLLMSVSVTAVAYLVLIKYRDQIGVEEDFTTMIQTILPKVLRG